MKRLVTAVLFLAAATGWAADAVRPDLREPVFAEAQAALARANDETAHVLAPDAYGDGSEAYRKAEEVFREGGKLTRIERLLAQAAESFIAAAQHASQNEAALSAPYAARADAKEAGAEDHAAELWHDAEVLFYEAATRLEKGREKAAKRYIERAEAAFREAELSAIDVRLLAGTEQQIRAAEDVDADRHAPKAFNQAVTLLEEARASLASDRYDTDRPRGLATDALHHARQAQYIALLWRSIDDDDISFEDALGTWERELRNVAGLLDLAIVFDDGPGDAGSQIGDAVVALQLRLSQVENQVSEQNHHASLLRDELERLQTELGGQSRARNRLQAELARQQRLKERVQRVENMFRADEAQIMRIEDRLVMRLVALNFASGKSDVASVHIEVLQKLINALSLFPETPIIVEGHTDSYGADLSNLELSNKRAEAIAQHLLTNSPLSPALVTSVGYGESKPIANNETTEGRARNRRIDVVLYPNW